MVFYVYELRREKIDHGKITYINDYEPNLYACGTGSDREHVIYPTIWFRLHKSRKGQPMVNRTCQTRELGRQPGKQHLLHIATVEFGRHRLVISSNLDYQLIFWIDLKRKVKNQLKTSS